METAAELLTTLRRSGVTLVAAGDRLRYCPREAVSPELRTVLAAHKAALLAVLREEQATQPKSLHVPDTGLDDGELGAVLIYSHALDAEVWLVRDEEALADIALEIAGRPVFLFHEIERLRGKTVEELRAIAASKRVFGPGEQVLQ